MCCNYFGCWKPRKVTVFLQQKLTEIILPAEGYVWNNLFGREFDRSIFQTHFNSGFVVAMPLFVTVQETIDLELPSNWSLPDRLVFRDFPIIVWAFIISTWHKTNFWITEADIEAVHTSSTASSRSLCFSFNRLKATQGPLRMWLVTRNTITNVKTHYQLSNCNQTYPCHCLNCTNHWRSQVSVICNFRSYTASTDCSFAIILTL